MDYDTFEQRVRALQDPVLGLSAAFTEIGRLRQELDRLRDELLRVRDIVCEEDQRLIDDALKQ